MNSFLRSLIYMGIRPNSRFGYHIYREYFNRIRLEKILEEIETSKKGPYYLIDYLMRQKQENIINRAINNRVRSRKYF